jgi:hypothetical protein
MDLANMRRQGARNLIAYCLNVSCRHQAVIDVSIYPADTLVSWLASNVVCNKCGARGRRIDLRPNWKEAPGSIDDWSGRPVIDAAASPTRRRKLQGTNMIDHIVGFRV